MLDWLKPRNWSRWWGDFFDAWWMTIPSPSIRPALPSMVGAALVLSLTGLAMVRDADWRTERVRQNLQSAVARNDQAEVELLCRRLLQQNADDRKLQLQLATALAKRGDRDAAVAMMQRLAIQQNDPTAVRWLLEEEYQEFTWADADPAERALYGALLKRVVEAGDAQPPLVATYVDLLIAAGDTEAAQPYLESLAASDPRRAVQAASLYHQAGNQQRAEMLARLALKQLERLTAEEPQRAEWYLMQSRLLVFQQRHGDALRLLKRGLDATGDVQLREAAAETLVVWGESLPREDSAAYRARRLRILQQALSLAPQNDRVLKALVPLVLESAQDDDPRVAQLRKSLVNGVAPELGHFIRGTAAMLSGDAEQATAHLEMATEYLPETPVILNNLAVALASRRTPNLEKALALVDAALAQMPDEPYMHETRGQILLKLKRHREAIIALEKAMSAKDLAEPIHRSLAIAYQAIGQPDIAAEHERVLAQLD